MKKLLLAIILFTVSSAPASAQLFYEIFGKNQHKAVTLGENQHYRAIIKTSEGNIEVKLHNETPIHRDNFVKLAQSDFYIGVLFHRVIKNFMIQAGDPTSREGSEVRTYGEHDAGYKLDAEIRPEFFHKKGTLAAARDSDDVNPEKKSSGSQFYIVTGKILNDSIVEEMREKMKYHKSTAMTPEREEVYRSVGGTPHLDGNYTIFGQVVRGQKIVDKISKMSTYKNNRPKKDVYIKFVSIEAVSNKKDKR